ncbi:hypothetical protein [Streptomyces boncukensis]|uniref:Uncharacterized protein n=1 Tax=Streptomyces boncukensis TaxID=2711219 RepID=A0A6G4WRP8_9ACTN|nr:hypothetical protein [Streptomyces boncukensis]NGO67875.1 hypothetical protein [Streptomyces boncukensis]
MTTRSAVRVNRRTHFVQVESATARDTRLSYRALGLLTYLLDQSDDWQVRSEQLSRGEGREGRDAVRKALHELAAHGYYRLERRRFHDGKQAMGTAISEYPVQQWADDFITFGKKLQIPVVEQDDGTFLVSYPDGSLGTDGFTPAPDDAPDTSAGADAPEQSMDDSDADTARPEEPQRVLPPAAARSAARRKDPPQGTPAPDTGKKAAEEPMEETGAEEVASWYYEHAKAHLGPYAGKQKSRWYHGLLRLTQQALDAGYTQRETAKALQRTGVHFPSAHQFQRALSDERNNKPVPGPYGGRPAPYSDAATWGRISEPPPPASRDPDEPDQAVQFGIVPA